MVSSSKPVTDVSKNDEKPEKFKGIDFKRWQQKMLFYMTTMNLTHIIQEECPKPTDLTSKKSMMTIDAWKNFDFLCRNYILNRLDDTLYDMYSLCNFAKELWDSLEKKYKIEDASAKKFVIAKFLKYIMVDTKTVMKQVEELQILIHELHLEGCSNNEHFQVGAIIEKLSPSWNDCRPSSLSLNTCIYPMGVTLTHRSHIAPLGPF